MLDICTASIMGRRRRGTWHPIAMRQWHNPSNRADFDCSSRCIFACTYMRTLFICVERVDERRRVHPCSTVLACAVCNIPYNFDFFRSSACSSADRSGWSASLGLWRARAARWRVPLGTWLPSWHVAWQRGTCLLPLSGTPHTVTACSHGPAPGGRPQQKAYMLYRKIHLYDRLTEFYLKSLPICYLSFGVFSFYLFHTT